eukprot:3545056-Prymnesium_polylepis.1
MQRRDVHGAAAGVCRCVQLGCHGGGGHRAVVEPCDVEFVRDGAAHDPLGGEDGAEGGPEVRPAAGGARPRCAAHCCGSGAHVAGCRTAHAARCAMGTLAVWRGGLLEATLGRALRAHLVSRVERAPSALMRK